MKNTPSRPPSLGTWLANLLAEQIIEGELPGGHRLLETELASAYQLSRAPVREALRMLEGDGLVHILHHRGAVVRQMTRQEVSNLYVCRAAVEGMAARLAATRLSDEQIAELHRLHDEAKRLADEENIRESFHVGLGFHAIVQEACGNAMLLDVIKKLSRRVQRLRFLLTTQPGRIVRSQAAGLAILAAFEARDPEAAERAQREIILSARDELLASNVLPDCEEIDTLQTRRKRSTRHSEVLLG